MNQSKFIPVAERARRAHALPRWQRNAIYGTALLVFVTGAVWLCLHHFFRREGEFGPESHPWEHVVLACHGGVALLLLWAFGSLAITHMRRAWNARRNRASGGGVVAAMAVLAITGWMLYYAGVESLREATALVHWVIGLGLSALLPVHIVLGRRSAAAVEHTTDGPSPTGSSAKRLALIPPATAAATRKSAAGRRPEHARDCSTSRRDRDQGQGHVVVHAAGTGDRA